jgi:hypothetical protein
MDRPLSDISQRLVISHHNEAAFKTGGLRDYSTYRDFGVAAARPEQRYKLTRCAVLSVLAWVAVGVSDPVAAQVIHDEFASGTFDKSVWAPCPRVENELAVMKDPASGLDVAKLTVHPYPDTKAFGLLLKKRNCIGETPFDDEAERAEIWEANDIRLRFGADVWYGFKMYIDETISPEEDRLVIGQWKGPNDDSPMVAQRFHQHIFTITIEQPNEMSGHDPADTQCRIVVAHDANFLPGWNYDEPHGLKLFEIMGKSGSTDLLVGSVGHDAEELIHTPGPCRTGVIVEAHNLLPDAFGKWIKMVYHLQIAGDGKGLLDVWANDLPIVTVRGQIGFPGSVKDKQYFKFGPYRNQNQLSAIYAMIAQYARGPRREDVE